MFTRALCCIFSLLMIAPPPSAGAQRQVTVTATSANIRSGPGTDQASLGTVRRGTVLDVVREVGGWYQVRLSPGLGLNASSGYIITSAVEVLRANSEPARTESSGGGSSRPSSRRGTVPARQPAFEPGSNLIGPRIGFPSQGGGIAVGANFEHAMSTTIGFGAFGDYWGYNESGIKYTYTAIGGTGSYHYKLGEDKRIDPFAGIAVGYYIVSVDLPDLCEQTDCRLNRGFIGGFGGIRYFVNPNIAATLRAGFGAAYLTAGVDVRF